jgi:hypothetical protein
MLASSVRTIFLFVLVEIIPILVLPDSSIGEKEKGWEVCEESQSKDKEEDA